MVTRVCEELVRQKGPIGEGGGIESKNLPSATLSGKERRREDQEEV